MSETYGEILYPSMDKLLQYVALDENDIFYDLGSGKGKVALQVFLQTNVREVHGIEISSHLHDSATAAKQKVFQDDPNLAVDRKLIFHQGNFLETPFDNATIVFICSTCFSQSLLRPLGLLIDRIESIHTVLTLRPICTLQRVSFKRAIRVECSWDSALCYVYSN